MQTPFEAVEALAVSRSQGQQLFKWGVRQTWAEGGEDPLEKVWAYACDGDVPHWHYVTSGMADPEKVESDPDDPESGLGYELSFRLQRSPGEDEAPIWPVIRLQELGWGIFKANLALDAGHYIRRRTVITGGDPPTELLGYYLIADPELPALESETGQITFLQVIGITEDELLRCESGDPDGVEDDLLARSPLGVTDLSRTVPRTEELDLERLSELQQAFVRACAETIPDGLGDFSVLAADDGREVEVRSEIPFELNNRARAVLQRVFLLHEAAGDPVNSVRCELTSGENEQWRLAMEFEY